MSFVEQYAKALLSYRDVSFGQESYGQVADEQEADGQALAAMHCLPCQMLAQEQLVFIENEAQLLAQLNQLQQTLQSMGITHIEPELMSCFKVTEHAEQQTVDWRFFDAQGVEQLQFCATYLLLNNKVATVVSHERQQAPRHS